MSAQCLICLNFYCDTSDIRIAECGHVFHYECATSWLLRSGECPQCRRPIYEEQLSKIYLSFTHQFEDETLRIELEAANVVLSTLKHELISLKSLADTAEAYKIKYDMMTKDVKIIQLELEVAQRKYNDSQTQLGELRMKCFGLDEEYDKSNDTIFAVKESLKIARSEIASLKKITASQEQRLKITNDTCYQLALSNQKTSCRAPISKGNIANILQNNDFVQKALDNKSYFEKCLLNKEFCLLTFQHVNEIKNFLKLRRPQLTFAETPNILKVNTAVFFNKNKNKNGTKIKNLDKVVEERGTQNYDNMNSSRNEKSCEIKNTKVVKNAFFNTTLEEAMLNKAKSLNNIKKDRTNNDNVHKPRIYSAKRSYYKYQRKQNGNI